MTDAATAAARRRPDGTLPVTGALRRFAALVLLGLVASLVPQALTPADAAAFSRTAVSRWIPNGTVFAMVRVGDTVYIGGDFTALRRADGSIVRARSHLAAVDAVTGQPKPWNPGADGTVRALAVGADGTVYAGGDFRHAGGQRHNRLVGINQNGAVLAGWHGRANDSVRALAASAEGLYVGGRFTKVDGETRTNLARVNSATGELDNAFRPQVYGGGVNALSLTDTKLVVGGAFTKVQGVRHKILASLDRATGLVDTWKPQRACRCLVLSLTTTAQRVYVGTAGRGGVVAAYRFDSDEVRWASQGDGDVQTLDTRGKTVFAGGHFSRWEGVERHQVVALAKRGGKLKRYRLHFERPDYPGVHDLIASDDVLILGGDFRTAGGRAARYAAFLAT